jgi:CDP-paratose 2-epimerase
VVGVDNNFRAAFFGSERDTRWTRHRLLESLPSYQHHETDIRDREAVLRLMQDVRPALIVHTAAQPSRQ